MEDICLACKKLANVSCTCDDQIKKQLISDFRLLLKGHIYYITSLVVTRDYKFIISGTGDGKIRI